jgi:hypothetical protein
MRPRPASLLAVLLLISLAILACGSNSHALRSVSVSPGAAVGSQVQFTATGIYNTMPTTVNITGTTTWCIGSSNGVCDGNIAQFASVTAGLAHCLPGFTGTVTVLAGQSGAMLVPDQGFQLQPFGAAQLTCQ